MEKGTQALLFELMEKNLNEDNKEFFDLLKDECSNNVFVPDFETNLWGVIYHSDGVKNQQVFTNGCSGDFYASGHMTKDSHKETVYMFSNVSEEEAIYSDGEEIEEQFSDFMRNKNSRSKRDSYSNVDILDMSHKATIKIKFS